MQQRIQRFWIENRQLLIFCILAAFVWGFAAHGYTMVNFQLSHDSLDGLYAAGRENVHKMELGRVLAPAYRWLFRGMFAMPWLTGILAFLWLGLGVWMMISALDLSSRVQIFLIAGLMTANLTVTSLAGTFVHDLDQDMFAMMMACLAVLMWQKRPRCWMIWGAAASAVCLGLYQSFISVSIGLIMIIALMQLLSGEKVWQVIRRATEGAAMLAAGGMLFWLMTQGILKWTGIEIANRNNSLSVMEKLRFSALPRLVKGLYRNWWEYYMAMPASWLTPKAIKLANAGLILFVGLTVNGLTLLRKDLSFLHKGLVILIALLLPLGLNVCYILTSGFMHHLMQYAFMLFYLLCLLLANHLCRRGTLRRLDGIVRWGCCVLAAVILWNGVQTANTYHFKKETASLATNARMTGVYADMLDAGYLPGKTPLVVDGQVPISNPEGFEEAQRVWGGDFQNSITTDRKSIRAYFQYVLGDDAAFCEDAQWDAVLSTPEAQTMPCYPQEGYITFVEDVLVVNLS